MRGTAHEYVWLDRAPPPIPAAVVTAATVAVQGPGLGDKVDPAREAAPGKEAAGGMPAEPGGHCQDTTAWWVMEVKIEARGLWL
jgi:hypothetical protein